MLNTKNKLTTIFVAATALISTSFISCSKDDDSPGGGNTEFRITDAPIDDVSVSGAFITISDIRLDGVSLQGFTKITVDLMAYQNGTTKSLGSFNLEGKTYNSVTFVLDFNADANGNAPGSYVLTTGGVKNKLESSGNEITITKSFTLRGDASNIIVADFDLRKIITRQATGASASDQYDFTTTAELQKAVRVIVQNNAGTVSGTISDIISLSDKVVVYAYKKGTFVRATEIQGQGSSNIQFSNAVASAQLSGRGQYTLHFLESGDYELHFVSYKDINADGRLETIGTLVIDPSDNLDLLNLSLGINATINVDGTVTSIIN